MFKDARALRAWRLYFLRAEAVLSPLASSVRRELIDDLKAHVTDILANDESEGDELTRLQAALARVGDPKEFLTPLLADAIFRMPVQHGSVGMAYRTLTLYASRGTKYSLRALGVVVAALGGAMLALSAFNSFIRPDRAGLFRIGDDEFQLRVFGSGPSTGEQLLAPWMAFLVIVLGLALVVGATRAARRMLLELIAKP